MLDYIMLHGKPGDLWKNNPLHLGWSHTTDSRHSLFLFLTEAHSQLFLELVVLLFVSHLQFSIVS